MKYKNKTTSYWDWNLAVDPKISVRLYVRHLTELISEFLSSLLACITYGWMRSLSLRTYFCGIIRKITTANRILTCFRGRLNTSCCYYSSLLLYIVFASVTVFFIERRTGAVGQKRPSQQSTSFYFLVPFLSPVKSQRERIALPSTDRCHWYLIRLVLHLSTVLFALPALCCYCTLRPTRQSKLEIYTYYVNHIAHLD